MSISATSSFNRGNVSGILNRIGGAVVNGVTQAGQQALTIEQIYTPVATGRLRDSETCDITETSTSVEANIGPRGVDYDVYVEFGTGRRGDPSVPHVDTREGMTPQPYARPTLDEMSGQVLGIVRDAVDEVL